MSPVVVRAAWLTIIVPVPPVFVVTTPNSLPASADRDNVPSVVKFVAFAPYVPLATFKVPPARFKSTDFISAPLAPIPTPP